MLLPTRDPNDGIIKDSGDTDWYTITQAYAIMTQLPGCIVRLKFIDRDNTVYPEGFNERFRHEVELLREVPLAPPTEAHIRNTTGHYLPNWYFDHLVHFRYKPEYVHSRQEGGKWEMYVEGPAEEVVRYEPSLLGITEQLLHEMNEIQPDPDFQEIVFNKARRLADLDATASEMDTRRRPYRELQELSMEPMKNGSQGHLKGTSNPSLAAKFELVIIGTMGHFWIQLMSGYYGPLSANLMAMIHWEKAFHGNLGTMLVDTFTTKKFLEDFGPTTAMGAHFANLFRGTREDSGSPEEHIDLMCANYQSLGIASITKESMHANSIDDVKIARIKPYIYGKLRDYYGIGGWWHKDLGCLTSNRVMKLWEMTRPQDPTRWIKLVKLANGTGKRSGDPRAIEYVLYALGLPE